MKHNVFAALYNQYSKNLFSGYLLSCPNVEIICNIDHLEDLKIKYNQVRDKVDTVILHQNLPGTSRPQPVIDMVRKLASDKRIIYISDNTVNQDAINSYLVSSHIYDFITDDRSNSNLKEDFLYLLENPRTYEQVSNFYSNSLVESLATREQGSIKRDNKKVVVKNKVINKTLPGFKKLILTVWDNPEFSAELAYTAAKFSSHKILLVDTDTLAPKLDLILNISKYPDQVSTDYILNSGLNIIFDSFQRNIYGPDTLSHAAIKRRELSNLYILTGNYDLNNYEYYKKELLEKLIEQAYQAFDLVILNVNKSIYDMFTIISLYKSDFNIVPVRADIDTFREFNDYINFLSDKQHIKPNKFLFVSWEYNKEINLSEKIILEVTKGKKYSGHVSYSKNRLKYRNLKLPYIRRADKDILDDYKKILTYFNVYPRRKLSDLIRDIFSRFLNSFRTFKRLLRFKSIRRAKKCLL